MISAAKESTKKRKKSNFHSEVIPGDRRVMPCVSLYVEESRLMLNRPR